MGGKSAYIRYVVPTPDDEEATVEYDLDEDDEEWLQRYCQVGSSRAVVRMKTTCFGIRPSTRCLC